MGKITGAEKHKATLRRIRGPAMRREIGKAIETAADIIASEAAASITTGSSGGKKKRSKHLHVPSKPGEPPNSFEGFLAASIKPEMTGRLTAIVAANMEYGAHLEFGTSKIEPRPFMAPAARKKTPEAQQLVDAAVGRVVKGGTL